MPDLSEFVGFVAAKSGVARPALVEQDMLIHRLLKELCDSPSFMGKYVFKGGSCLVKCYFGYYRFSVDLDFTWKDHGYLSFGGKELQRRLKAETMALGQILEDVSKRIGLDFKNDRSDKRYFEFGGSKRMVTFKLWKGKEFVKVQVNFVEEMLFAAKKKTVKTLLDGVSLRRDETVYFEEQLAHYAPFDVDAYDEREILCEKVRAILTRRAQKLRDFYDLFVLDSRGFKVGALIEESTQKTKASFYYNKYRDNFEANKKAIELDDAVLESPFERSLFIVTPPPEFDRFVEKLSTELLGIAGKVQKS
ncbi:MAG: nucleotidyl transferase AbiEii/AbiGii toxin family protein [Pseudomonadota bacterium]